VEFVPTSSPVYPTLLLQEPCLTCLPASPRPPVAHVLPNRLRTPTTVTSSTPVKTTPSGKSHSVSFARTASASTEGEGDFDDEEWVDPTRYTARYNPTVESSIPEELRLCTTTASDGQDEVVLE